MVKVRFAPSPTGHLHIGSARTALFNYLFARHHKGTFVLRIEDTDQKRSDSQFLNSILDDLKWLGLRWDEELYFQSQRLNIYQEYAQKLVKENLAYLDKEAVILPVPPGKIKFKDLIRGEIEFDSNDIKEQVLIKSDKTPTYNFACVIDDALMNITHVIRGDDHISNTPKQIILYQALGFKVPEFAHIPLILGMEGGRLSKRSGATSISDYHQLGYLPKALLNYLLLLGWAPGGNRELIEIDEAIKLFDLKNANKTAATFDLNKLNWINNQYLKKEDPSKLAEEIIPQLMAKGYISKDNFNRDYIVALVKLFQARLTTINDFVKWADFFFVKGIKIDPEAENKFLSRDLSQEFKLFIQRLEALDKFEVPSIEATFREMAKELNIESKVLIHPIRVALTGKTIGPGLFEVIYYLGREMVKERLSRWIK